MEKLRFIIPILFALSLFLFGCTQNITVTEIGTYPRPLIKPLPLKVGAYYSEDFATYHIIQKQHGMTNNIELGKANIALFDYILFHGFEKVTPVQNLSEHFNDTKDIDLIIEPKIYEYFFFIFPDISVVRIVYSITFYTPDGERIGPWLIEGYANVPSRIRFTFPAVELTQMAMREVAAKFMTGICSNTETRKLFHKQCTQ